MRKQVNKNTDYSFSVPNDLEKITTVGISAWNIIGVRLYVGGVTMTDLLNQQHIIV